MRLGHFGGGTNARVGRAVDRVIGVAGLGGRPRHGNGWSEAKATRGVGSRVLLVALVLSALVGSLVGPAPRAAEAVWGATVATSSLNVRAGAGTWAEVLGSLPYGTWVRVVSGPVDGAWYEIRGSGLVGWAHGGHLNFEGDGAGAASPPPPATDRPASGGSTAWVDTAGLVVRQSADLTGLELDTLAYGTQVTVLAAEINGFMPIAYGGGAAYVWAGYLRWDGGGSGGQGAAAPAGPAAPAAPSGPERWIDVDRSSGLVTLYEGGAVWGTYWGSMGWDQSEDGFFATANGTYEVFAKERGLHWTPWGQTFIRFYVAFDPARSNGFHTYSLDANGNMVGSGQMPTGGCVAFLPEFAEIVFDFARIGTRVEVHW